MDHQDHVRLLRAGVADSGGTWADLGAGRGAFTLALAELLPAGATIIAIDRDARALDAIARELPRRTPAIALRTLAADFSRPLDLLPLDGIVMANALHFVRDKLPVLVRLRGLLRPGGRFVLVEYNTDRGNTWVPHPLAYPAWQALAAEAGFVGTRRIARAPSSFLGEFYAALSVNPPVSASRDDDPAR